MCRELDPTLEDVTLRREPPGRAAGNYTAQPWGGFAQLRASLVENLRGDVVEVGCNWNRRVEAPVREAGFRITAVEGHKIYSTASPAAFPLLLIKAER